MRRAALIYNPASGQHSERRASYVRSAVEVLRKAGVETEALETHAPGSARSLAQGAVRQGYDAIVACGGDGTVHEALQSVVGTEVALGVLPLGTANALAQNLGLGRSPVKAARALLSATPVEVPVGKIFFQSANGVQSWRYFTVAAGVGADALLMSSMDPALKRRYGYALYLVEAFRIWATVAGRQTFHRHVELIDADAVECRPSNGSSAKLLVEADGEVLGALPARLEVASETVRLLVPPHAEP